MSIFGGLAADLDFDASHSPHVYPFSSLIQEGLVESTEAAIRAETHRQDGQDSGSSSDGRARHKSYAGPGLTWQRYTADERALYSSLEQMQANELSTHLYNVHAMKERLRSIHPGEAIPGQSKRRWTSALKEGRWIPPDAWTAWPLEPDIVPRHGEAFGVPAPDEIDQTIIKREIAWKPSTELEDILLALILNKAKGNIRRRVISDDGDYTHHAKRRKQEGLQPPTIRGKSREVHASITPSDSPIRSSRDNSLQSSIITDSQTEVQTDFIASGELLTKQESAMNNPDLLQDDPMSNHVDVADRRGSTEHVSTISEATHISNESSESLCSNGKQIHGEIYTDANKEEADTGSETFHSSIDDEQARQISQPIIRSILEKVDCLLEGIYTSRRNHFHDFSSATDSEGVTGTETEAKTKKTKAKKPSPRYKLAHRKKLEDDTAEYSQSTSDDSDQYSSVSPIGSLGRVGLIDWSELLSTASMIDLPADSVQRAVQRCCSLFNESMSLRDFKEGTHSKLVKYVPQLTETCENDTYSSGRESISLSNSEPDQRNWLPRYRGCPNQDCEYHETAFKSLSRLAQHIKRVHQYDPRSGRPPKIAETVGNVHVDGFLQPIQRQKGWRGKDKMTRKKSRESLQSDTESDEL